MSDLISVHKLFAKGYQQTTLRGKELRDLLIFSFKFAEKDFLI